MAPPAEGGGVCSEWESGLVGRLAVGVSSFGGRSGRRAALRRRSKRIGSAVKLCEESAATKKLETGFLARGGDV